MFFPWKSSHSPASRGTWVSISGLRKVTPMRMRMISTFSRSKMKGLVDEWMSRNGLENTRLTLFVLRFGETRFSVAIFQGPSPKFFSGEYGELKQANIVVSWFSCVPNIPKLGNSSMIETNKGEDHRTQPAQSRNWSDRDSGFEFGSAISDTFGGPSGNFKQLYSPHLPMGLLKQSCLIFSPQFCGKCMALARIICNHASQNQTCVILKNIFPTSQ